MLSSVGESSELGVSVDLGQVVLLVAEHVVRLLDRALLRAVNQPHDVLLRDARHHAALRRLPISATRLDFPRFSSRCLLMLV